MYFYVFFFSFSYLFFFLFFLFLQRVSTKIIEYSLSFRVVYIPKILEKKIEKKIIVYCILNQQQQQKQQNNMWNTIGGNIYVCRLQRERPARVDSQLKTDVAPAKTEYRTYATTQKWQHHH